MRASLSRCLAVFVFISSLLRMEKDDKMRLESKLMTVTPFSVFSLASLAAKGIEREEITARKWWQAEKRDQQHGREINVTTTIIVSSRMFAYILKKGKEEEKKLLSISPPWRAFTVSRTA